MAAPRSLMSNPESIDGATGHKRGQLAASEPAVSKKQKPKSVSDQAADKAEKDAHLDTIAKAREENVSLGRRGAVSVDRLPHWRAKTGSKKWPIRSGFKNINVCSSAPGMWKTLSPMIVGPVHIAGFVDMAKDPGQKLYGVKLPAGATNVENLWQFSKVWSGEEESDGRISRMFFERRAAGFKDPKPHRHVKKGDGANPNVPLYSLWGEERLSYLEARKKIYCPIYAALVTKTAAYKQLRELVDSGTNVQILGYDGYDYGTRTMKDLLEDPSRPFGHEMVLACLLTDQRPWE